MARPIPYDTYMVNIDETETFFPRAREEEIINLGFSIREELYL